MTGKPAESLVGGPLDGRSVGLASRPAFGWFGLGKPDEHGRSKLTCFRKPARGRILYRRARWREGVLGEPTVRVRSGYVYAGLTHRQCSDCDVFVERRVDQEACPLCGGAFTRMAEV